MGGLVSRQGCSCAYVPGNAQVLGLVGCLVDSTISSALERGGVIDITTIGARSGSRHRVEIVFHHFDGSYYITGKPGVKRDWLANLNANPEFTVHLKRGITVDVPAAAQEITDQDQRAKVLYRILTESWDNEPSKAEHILPRWVEDAPLVEFTPT
jgi:deazaflavin-dependent oxidoreductase (nitroreductase family)